MSHTTANQYNMRLHKFESFIIKEYGESLDTIVEKLIQNKVNPHKILTLFSFYLTPTECNNQLGYILLREHRLYYGTFNNPQEIKANNVVSQSRERLLYEKHLGSKLNFNTPTEILVVVIFSRLEVCD